MMIIVTLVLTSALLTIEISAASSPIKQDVSTFNTRGRRKLQRCREKDDDEFRTASRGNKRPCSWLKNDRDHIKEECGNRKSGADEVCPVTCGACKDNDDDDEEPDDLGKDFDELEYLGDGFKSHGKCSGNCKRNDDCNGILECFERGGGEVVPGCEGRGKEGVNYCFDPNDVVIGHQQEPVVVEIAPKTLTPAKAPASKKPTGAPTLEPTSLSPTRNPTKSYVVEQPNPTTSPTQAPVIQGSAEEQDEEDYLVNSPDKAIMPEDIGVEVPSFVVGITYLTPSRRRLGVLADNIDSNKLESIVADIVGQRMFAIYPDTFQDVDIETELVSETKQKEITTVMYECSGQAIFLDAFSSVEGSRLPHAKDLWSIVLEALEDGVLSEKLRSSDDAVLSASQATFVAKSGAEVLNSSDSPDNLSVGIVILVALIVGCALLIIGSVSVYIFRTKSNGKNILPRALNKQECNGFAVDDEIPSASGGMPKDKEDSIVPSPSRTHSTNLDNSYDRDSNAGDYSVGYSESVLESIVDGGSIGRYDGGSSEDAPAEVALDKNSVSDPSPDRSIRAGNLRVLDT